MSQYTRLVLTTPGTTADFDSVCPLTGDKYSAGNSLASFIAAATSGTFSASLSAKVGAVPATATIVSTGSATNNETITICNVVFTAKTSGATGNQFNVSGTPATQAANIAAAVNASTNLSGIVTASANSGTVTLTAVVPGKASNGLALTEALTNVTVTAFTGGSDGTSYSYDLG